MSQLLTTADIASRCNVALRTAQRHAEKTSIGRMVGGVRVFTPGEADKLAAVVKASKPGRPLKSP